METALEHGGPPSMLENDPLSPEQVAAFLDGKLEGAELEQVESQLAANPAARQELIKSARIIATTPSHGVKKWPRFYPLIGLAAAAAIAIVVIRPDKTSISTTPVSTERRSIADEPDRILLVSPANSQRVTKRDEPFTWRAVPGATYRVVISDASGNTAFQTDTNDTTLIIPPSVRDDGIYYWRVDALAPDGTSLTSGIHDFVLSDR